MDILKKLHLSSGVNDGVSNGDAKWKMSSTKLILNSYNPSNEKLIAQIQTASPSDIETVIAASAKTFEQWCQVPAPKRGELVRQIAEELRAKKEWLAALITLECGKITQEALGEVQEMIDMADFAVGMSRMLYGKTMHSERPQHRMYEQWHPFGVTLVITAFNFPVAVWAWNAFIAAICGNTVIWKPSSKVALCALAVQQICMQVSERLGYTGVFATVVTDDNELATKMVQDKRVKLVSFTGSVLVGKKIDQWVAQRMGRSILELSGNNPVIVDETANLDLALTAVLFAAVGTSGQRCTSARRLFLHEKIYHEFLERLIKLYKKIKIGDPTEKGVLMGPLIDKGAVDKFVQAIEEIKRMGGEILYGGEVLQRTGYFVMPTIVTANNDWNIVQRETFAPILYVMSFKYFEEAIHMQNAATQGLSSSLFTQSLRHAEYFLSVRGSDCGIANVNVGTSGAEIGGAFGGEKETGGGREAGSDAWKAYMRRQTNTINWGIELPLAQGVEFKVN